MLILTDHIPHAFWKSVADEARRLLDEFSERRDLRLATTDYTPRSMSVVPSETIAKNSDIIRSIYESPELRALIEALSGTRLLPCPSKDEEFLIARQERASDTHGWHWGDYSFALIWIVEAPSVSAGGMLQCIPHTRWNKEKPRINEYLCENTIRTYRLSTGDVYLLRTDTTLHRTVPLTVDTTRIMLNMTWASEEDAQRPLRGDDRWWEDPTVSAAHRTT